MTKTLEVRNRLLNKLAAKNVYSKQSSIAKIGQGLYAARKINAGEQFVEFTGKLHSPTDNSETNRRSTLMFADGYALSCPADDLASFANDCVELQPRRRKLLESLKKDEPFYKKYPGSTINCDIVMDNINHRAYLEATQDIEKDAECWTHYSFPYWFGNEAINGFEPEIEIQKNGFPDKIFEYSAFKLYIKEFYPDSTGHDIIKGMGVEHCVKINFPNKKCVYLDLPDYKNMFKFTMVEQIKKN